MTYDTALRRLYCTASRGVRLGLDRVGRAARELGDPHKRLWCVQVAGTNGKGSVANMVAHGARAAGLKTGLYTSPHLHRFAERIQVDGAPADPDLLARELEQVLDLADGRSDLPLTFFEIATLAAFLHFAGRGVDLAVLEVGLGGRFDATSIADPSVTAVTSIGLDHTALLGDTLDRIAREKAAIARNGAPMVVGRLPDEALAAVAEVAGAAGAPLRILGRDFEIPDGLRLAAPVEYQRGNSAVALEIFRLLGARDPRLDPRVFLDALPTARWPGRFERLETEPAFLLDGAHNAEAATALADSLDRAGVRPELLLFGALRDKPAREMLAILSRTGARRVLVPPPIARSWAPADFAAPGDAVARSVAEGLAIARALGGARATILVTGSLFTVAEARRILLDLPADPPVGL